MNMKTQKQTTADTPKATLLKAINGAVSLPALPTVVARLVGVVDSPEDSNDQLAKLVSSDPVIALRILKQANSSYYDFSKSICTIQTAISVLGADAVKDVALGIPVFEWATDNDDILFDESLFWEHSVACGVCARMLAEDMGDVDQEEAYLAGLIHDIGRLVMSLYTRDAFLRAVSTAMAEGEDLGSVEAELLGVDHSELGGRLGKNWNLPPKLYEAVMFHHDPQSASPSTREMVCIVNLADAAANSPATRTFDWAKPLQPNAYALSTLSLDGPGTYEQRISELADRFRSKTKIKKTVIDPTQT